MHLYNMCTVTSYMQLQMKMMMTGGQSEIEKAMAEDPETYECVTKLNEIMGKLNMGG